MITDTQPRQTTTELRDEMLIGIGDRENAIHVKIGHASAELHNLQIQARKHGEWQNHDASQMALRQAGQHNEAIRAMNKELKDLDFERQSVVHGYHPQLHNHGQAERSQHLHSLQQEHTEALTAFNEQLTCTGGLIDAAKRLIAACTAMHHDIPAPAAAVEIMKLASKGG
jgi:pyruvate-formate lyase-activating enzyme